MLSNRIGSFIGFDKVREGAGNTRIVSGIITDETLDFDGEIIDYEASKRAVQEWAGNIREMHQKSAVGKAITVQCDDSKRQIRIEAKVVDPVAVLKVDEGIYTGFSVAGDRVKKQSGRIVDYRMVETSLVDTPANPSARIDLVRAAGIETEETNVENETPGTAEELAADVAKAIDADIAAAADAEPAADVDKALEAAHAAADALEKSADTEAPAATETAAPTPAETPGLEKAFELIAALDAKLTEIHKAVCPDPSMKSAPPAAGAGGKGEEQGEKPDNEEGEGEKPQGAAKKAADTDPEEGDLNKVSDVVANGEPFQKALTAMSEATEQLRKAASEIGTLKAQVGEIEKVLSQPIPGGPITNAPAFLKAHDATVAEKAIDAMPSTATSEEEVAIKVLKKMRDEATDPLMKARFGEQIFDLEAKQLFRQG